VTRSLIASTTGRWPSDVLSASQRATLGAIVDSFAPAVDGVPAASELGAVAAIEDAVERAPREADRKQFALLLSALGSRALTLATGGGLRRFADLDLAARERLLLGWADSRLVQRRAVFQALRKASLSMTYMTPGPARRNPRWAAISYPGPPSEPPPQDAPKRLEPLAVGGDTELDCDVVVVGSGAGGGVAAATLADAGLDVIVVEAGGYYNEADFDGAELAGYDRLYLGGGALASDDQSVGLLAGSCLGGGTVVNYTTSFRTPDEVRAEWAALGAGTFAGEDYERSMDAVCERLGVNYEHSKPGSRDVVMKRGLDELGWHSDFMPRNVRGCDQGERCGYCGYGCPYGAKQSTLRTWLEDAAQRGGRIICDAFVERIIHSGGQARGVVAAYRPSGATVTITSKAVVLAAGALHTPALMRRSGMSNRLIGKNLHLHPATAVWGVFDEQLDPWGGTLQAVYSDEHRDLDGNGYGLKYETAPNHPSLLLTFAPWRSARQHFDLMSALAHTTPIGVLLRDHEAGEVKTGRDGQPVVSYRLSPTDQAHLRTGIEGGARILQAAGARRVFTSHARLVAWDAKGEPEQLMSDADAAGYGSGQVTLASFHIMGSARMGGAAASSACDPYGRTWELQNVVVCDASAFPTASGVNPMITIESLAHMNARALAARLG
jgi:choline dehydrogenase-like flavoprotein